MIAVPTHQPIFLCTTPTDMRKSFCGLTGRKRGQVQFLASWMLITGPVPVYTSKFAHDSALICPD